VNFAAVVFGSLMEPSAFAAEQPQARHLARLAVTRRVVHVDDADLETPTPMTPSAESVAFRTVPIASLGRLVA
jgi:hypothetical protein